MKHKHHDLIVAKAANMDLVVFSKNQKDGSWLIQNDQGTTDFGDCVDYFLCLPQHNENGQCLNWLNGIDVEIRDRKGFYPFACYAVNGDWHPSHAFMSEHEELRIKPHKEKRWIAFNHKTGSVYGAFLSEDKCTNAWPLLQVFEIEVEVENGQSN